MGREGSSRCGPRHSERRLPGWLVESPIVALRIDRSEREFETHGFGWPAVSLSYTLWQPEWFWPHMPHRAIDVRPLTGRRVHLDLLPLQVHWLGLASNMLVLGAVPALAGVVGGALRRGVRTRHGRCPVCRYDLAGLTARVCPECGRTVDAPKSADSSGPLASDGLSA
jgi:hypothetical protein